MSRDRCKAVALAVLTKLLLPETIQASNPLQLREWHVQMCFPPVGAVRYCHHLHGVLEGLTWARPGFPQQRFLGFLLFLHGLISVCLAVSRQLQELIPTSAQAMDSQATPASFTDDPPAEAAQDRRESQRSSGDADTGRGPSTVISCILACEWILPIPVGEVARPHAQLAEAWKVSHGCQALHVSADGSWVSQPAREVEVTFAWHAHKQVGVCPAHGS